MTTPRLEGDGNPALARLIEDGSRLVPLGEHERAALFARIESRRARAVHARRWSVACAGVAGALALTMLALSPSPAPSTGTPSGEAASGAVTTRTREAESVKPAIPAPTPRGASVPPSLAIGTVPAPIAPADVGAAAAAGDPSSPRPSPAGSAGPESAAPIARKRAPRAMARHLSLGGRAELELDAEAAIALPRGVDRAAHGPVRVRLERGRARAHVAPRAPDEPFTIATPHVEVVVVGTRFSVSVAAATTTVAVEHGSVRVEKAGRSLLVAAGEAVRSDDARLNRALPPPGVTDSTCSASAEPQRRRDCLAQAAIGSGLSAQNALLALGLLERDELGDRVAALSHFRQYEQRHPRGVLAPEVALALVQTLMMDGQHPAARAAAHDYERRFPEDSRTARRLQALTNGSQSER